MPDPAPRAHHDPQRRTSASRRRRGARARGRGRHDRAPRRRHAAHPARRRRPTRSSVRCAPGTDVTVGTVSGNVELVGPLGAVRVATVSGRDPGRGGDAHRRAHEVGEDRHRHVRGRVPGHDQELDGARAAARAARRSPASPASCCSSDVGGAEIKTRQRQGADRVDAAPTASSVHTVSGKVEIRVPAGARPATRLRSLSGTRRLRPRAGRRLRDRGRRA